MQKKKIVTALAVVLGLSAPSPALWAAHHEGSDAHQVGNEAKPAEATQQEAGAEGTAGADQGTMPEGGERGMAGQAEGTAGADQGTMPEGGERGMAGQAEGSASESSH